MATPERLTRTLTGGGVVLLALLFASQMYVWINWWPIKIGWGTALAWSLPQLAVWLLLSPLAPALSRRLPLDRGQRGARIAIHGLISIGFGVAGLVLLDLSDRLLHWATLMGAPELITRLRYTIIHLHWGTAIYWVLLGADHTMRYYREVREREVRSAQLETQLSRAQLATLRVQLNPHFLFNTLNSIAVLVRRDPAGAEDMLHRLSAFLRGTLDGGEIQLAPLSDELDRLRDYVSIEQRRFRDRLTVRFDVEPGALGGLVPTFLLQPLVENALRHGVAPKPGPVTVDIVATRSGDRLHLAVRDDGAGLAASYRDGVGLANTRRRLEVLFGPAASFRLTSRAGGGTEAWLDLPWRTTEAAA
jgi:two-component system LytT family sensor kinase